MIVDMIKIGLLSNSRKFNMTLIYLLCSKTPKCIYPLYYNRNESINAKTKLYDNVMKERFRKDAGQCKLIHVHLCTF